MSFLEAIDGTLIAVKSIKSIEPYRGGWGHVVYYSGDRWKWVDPSLVTEMLERMSGRSES